jgi:putative acyl-CoA dehydrogenase
MTFVLQAVESEANTLLAFRVAQSFDNSTNKHEEAFMRIATPVVKYHICKRAPALAYEAVECHGGNGLLLTQHTPSLLR